jgi:hypothetical protein
MRLSLLPLSVVTLCCLLPGLHGQERSLTAPGLPDFLSRYSQGLQPLDKLYAELADENFSLRDECGQPLARRHIEDRQRALDDLRKSVQQLASTPQDLTLAIRLFLQSETLSDDLFSLSQVAYDNNREELGKRFSDLLVLMDRHNALLESYVLEVAAERQERIRDLEKENSELRQKLREAAAKTRAGASRLPGVAGPPSPSG